jgi:CheY-like chemotaxis protein
MTALRGPITANELTTCRILMIDDEPANISLLRSILEREGYTNLIALTDPTQALQTFVDESPDIVLLDLMMPGVDGYALLDAFCRQTPPNDFRPILVLTADTTPNARRRALSLGAKDFVNKPFDVVEVALRIANLLETRVLYRRLLHQT